MQALLFLACLGMVVVSSRKAWYYTGEFSHDINGQPSPEFHGRAVDHSNTFYIKENTCVEYERLYGIYDNASRDWNVFYGNVLLGFKNISDTFDSVHLDYLKHTIPEFRSNEEFKVCGIVHYELCITADYASESGDNKLQAQPLQIEIGLFDEELNEYEEKRMINATIGGLISAVVILGEKVHEISYSHDNRGHFALMKHSFFNSKDMSKRLNYNTDSKIVENVVDNSGNIIETKRQKCDNSRSQETTKSLSILTYNIWHNNPPDWTHQVPRLRWNRYEERLRYLASLVVDKDPDIIVLQEVRIDIMFPSRLGSASNPHFGQKSPPDEHTVFDMGGQLDHVLKYINHAKYSRDSDSKYFYPNNSDYHVVFHPAMLMVNKQRLFARQEEGLVIMSKLPLENSEVLLLTRNLRDGRDDHQRIVLKATVDISESDERDAVEIMTTHLSLSENARMNSINEINTFSDELSKTSDIQFILGDFNAELSEKAMKHLVQNEIQCHDESYHSSSEMIHPNSDDSLQAGKFIDIWCKFIHEKLSADMNDQTDKDEQLQFALKNGFTFPTNEPIKRIDFSLLRDDCHRVHVTSVETIGKHYKGESQDDDSEVSVDKSVGMLDKNSPLWASDHFGLLTKVSIHM